MDNNEWKLGAEAVFNFVSQWGADVLGPDYVLVRNGMFGPHGLFGTTNLPQRLHLDSVRPFFSGLDLAFSDSRFSPTCNAMLVML